MTCRRSPFLGQVPRVLLVLLFLSVLTVHGSGQKNKEYILKNTNVAELQRMSEQWSAEYEVKHAEALRIAKEKGWPTEGLQYITENGRPIYHSTDNDVAAFKTNTNLLRSNLGVQGQGFLIGVWDVGHVLLTHQDMSGRVTQGDAATYSPKSHATHVGGTLIGNPPSGTASRGMAPQADLKSYDSGNHFSEMALAAALGMLVSNHSYSPNAGWEKDTSYWCNILELERWDQWTWYGGTSQFNSSGDDPLFGQYTGDARRMDSICYNAQMYLPVFSSSNEHTENPEDDFDCKDEVRDGLSGTYVDYDPDDHPVGDGEQLSNIKSYSNAKNILTIGNVDVFGNINSSSSRGMTDDGRIKPDICGMGTNVYSAESSSNTAYGLKTGTSQATPNVAGSLLLLQEVYENYHGSGIFMRSATLKGLAIHSATDLGNPGPDVTYGWGLLDANRAGDMIVKDAALLETRILEKPTPVGLAYTFYSDGSIPIRVTLCYTDVPGTATSVHNDATAKLVNDLDVTLVLPGVSTSYPYVLSMSNPSANATTGDNDRDNVEQIYVQNPVAGQYEVHVNVEGALTGAQPYSLIVSGIVCENAANINQGNGFIAPNTYFGRNITSTGTVSYGATVTHQALESIVLLPGFSGHFGSHYTGKIEGCQ